MLSEFQDWYGWRTVCLTCGDEWMDGEMVERSFIRGWRKDNVKRARARMKSYFDAKMSQGLDAFMGRLKTEMSEQVKEK
jgi:hypothetical protein